MYLIEKSLLKDLLGIPSIIPSIPCIKSLPRTKIFLGLLLTRVELFISAPKIITFLPYPPLGCEKDPFESNPIPYPEYFYLSISAFFVNLTAPNRQFSKVTYKLLVLETNL